MQCITCGNDVDIDTGVCPYCGIKHTETNFVQIPNYDPQRENQNLDEDPAEM